MPTIEQRLEASGHRLPQVSKPLAAYVPTMRTGNTIYTSGQLPVVDGVLAGTGKVGQDVTLAQAQQHARTCVLNALAAIKAEVGDLQQITQITKVVGFVASAPEFVEQHLVINGASEFLGDLFGDVGIHARSAVGVAVLPMNAPVEIELIVQVAD